MKQIGYALLIAVILLTLSFCTRPTTRPPVKPVHRIEHFREAKKLANKFLTQDHRQTFYCGCDYNKRRTIDPKECGYLPRKNAHRGKRMEWEHIVPAHAFGKERPCWQEPLCERKGKSYKGRKCCKKIDPLFRSMEADLHNLVPSVGELNADHSNRSYGMVAGQSGEYGTCDFKVNFESDTVQPRPGIRGNIARTYFYFEKTYQLPIRDKQRKLFERWDKEDPVDAWERQRNKRIQKIQGNGNPFVASPQPL